MAYKPILFNTEMVQAIQTGRKTQTRRIAFVADALREFSCASYPDGWWYEGRVYKSFESFVRDCQTPKCKYRPGDILWVREAYCEPYAPGKYSYRADYEKYDVIPNPVGNVSLSASFFRWKPSIHMPKQAARIFLRVKDVRVERLTDTTDKDAAAEGVPDGSDYPVNPVYCPFCSGTGTIGTHHPDSLGYMPVVCPECDTPKKRFSYLWDSTIKPADLGRYGWNANPWVWVIEFEHCEKTEGWPDV